MCIFKLTLMLLFFKKKYKKSKKSKFTTEPNVKRKKLRDQLAPSLVGDQAIENNKNKLHINWCLTYT